MPDSKITALTSISTSTDPANDPLVIVDVSDTSMAATGTTKKVTLNNLLACSPTATLASATITGDLTVDTSTLKVDSANNRVGIGTASPSETLHVSGGASDGVLKLSNTASGNAVVVSRTTGEMDVLNAANSSLRFWTNTVTRYTIDNTGVSTWSVGGSTAMTLNATGLGVGVASPAFKLDIAGSIQSTSDVRIKKTGSDTFAAGPFFYLNSGDGGGNGSALQLNATNGLDFWNSTGGTWSKRMTLDINGNLSLQSDKYLGWGNLDSLIYGSSTSNYIYFRTNATERVRVKGGGQLRFIPLAADPAGAEAGDVYYNSSSNKLKCYNGTTWNDLF